MSVRASGSTLLRRKNRDVFPVLLEVAPWHDLDQGVIGAIGNARVLTVDIVEEMSAMVMRSPFEVGRRVIQLPRDVPAAS